MKIQTHSGFFRPFAIQKDANENFLVANFIKFPSVGIFDSNFKLVGWLTYSHLSKQMPSPSESPFVGPHSIAIDDRGQIFVNDYRARRILKFSKEGDFLEIFLSAEKCEKPWHLAGPAAAQIDLDGNFIVSDFGSSSLQKFSPDAKFLSWLGARSDGAVANHWQTTGEPLASKSNGGFDRPHSVGFDRKSGEMIVADTWNHRLQKFSTAGEFIGWLGQTLEGEVTRNFQTASYAREACIAGGFSAPVSLDIEDDVFVVSEYGNSRIQKFSLDGKFFGWLGEATDKTIGNFRLAGECQIGDQPGAFHHPYDVKIKNGNILVADSDNHRIQILSF